MSSSRRHHGAEIDDEVFVRFFRYVVPVSLALAFGLNHAALTDWAASFDWSGAIAVVSEAIGNVDFERWASVVGLVHLGVAAAFATGFRKKWTWTPSEFFRGTREEAKKVGSTSLLLAFPLLWDCLNVLFLTPVMRGIKPKDGGADPEADLIQRATEEAVSAAKRAVAMAQEFADKVVALQVNFETMIVDAEDEADVSVEEVAEARRRIAELEREKRSLDERCAAMAESLSYAGESLAALRSEKDALRQKLNQANRTAADRAI